ncbi:MAG: response regulator, partial [Phycisphaerae bacterium]|nr:response regulator [Phycisphaerae bacterium]
MGDNTVQSDPKRILIVDNEPQVCLLIEGLLSRRGFDCHSVADPVEAREIIKTDRYDLIITDISMPKVSGLELLILAKQHAPKCKVILTTGLSSREYLAQALILGAYDYVEKPFDMDELVETVRGATGGEGKIPQLSMRAAEA